MLSDQIGRYAKVGLCYVCRKRASVFFPETDNTFDDDKLLGVCQTCYNHLCTRYGPDRLCSMFPVTLQPLKEFNA